MDLITKMVEHHVWLTGEMVARAARLEDDILDEPIEISVEGLDDDPTLRSLLSRLVGQMAMWNAAMACREYDWSVESTSRSSRCSGGWPPKARSTWTSCAMSPSGRWRHVRRRPVRAGRGVHIRR